MWMRWTQGHERKPKLSDILLLVNMQRLLYPLYPMQKTQNNHKKRKGQKYNKKAQMFFSIHHQNVLDTIDDAVHFVRLARISTLSLKIY
jgi:hypothetical protein